MSPVNHAAVALVLKKKWPNVSIWPLLIGTQLFDIGWIVFNFARIERTETGNVVRAINDVHFVYMPLSHSIFSTILVALAVWLICALFLTMPILGLALAIAIASHLVLDIFVHLPDIAISPFDNLPRIGFGLYGIPLVAFVIELAFAIACWKVFQGSWWLLLAILAINVLSITLFMPMIQGLEIFFSNAPLLFVGFVGIGTLVSVLIVGFLARP